MNIQQDLQQRLEKKPILLMTHLVLGYPSLEVNREVIRQMADNGVDCIELQIPFSEPMADGPVILKANQDALASGIRVEDSFAFAKEMVREFPQVNFLFMTYYNIVFRYGLNAFIERAADIGMKGFILPDLPPEEGKAYLHLAKEKDLAAIMFFTPTSTDERMVEVAGQGSGFVYCVARKGVTGQQTAMDDGLAEYLRRCRRATDLPLAVGFGISSREDVALLEGKADMAVIGTATIKLVDQEGPEAVGPFIRSLAGESR
ncbi:MAG: tryptophan synthase subunit alpha [Candidatus Electrothrix communis]|nr:tryptophan synthase subunit alpha [Desulfobulbus sp. US4]WLE98241.1 MAG: tryptophan synthase subunit alpha [Candidatus Electrothrix communis]